MAVGVGQRAAPTIWQIPDDLWLIVQHVLPREELQRSRGRPWIPPRRILDAVLYVLRTGCQWKAVPREFGSGSTVHRRFQRWVDYGVWAAMWRLLLQYYDAAVRSAAAVGAGSARDAGSSNARTPGSTVTANCSSAGRRSPRTTSRSYNSPPHSSCGALWDRL